MKLLGGERKRGSDALFAGWILTEREGEGTLGVGSEEESDEQKETEERAEGNLHPPAEVGEGNALVRIEGGDQQEVHQFAYQDTEGHGQLEGGTNAA